MVSLAFLPRLMPQPNVRLIISFLLFTGGGLIEVLVSIVDSLPGEAKAVHELAAFLQL